MSSSVSVLSPFLFLKHSHSSCKSVRATALAVGWLERAAGHLGDTRGVTQEEVCRPRQVLERPVRSPTGQLRHVWACHMRHKKSNCLTLPQASTHALAASTRETHRTRQTPPAADANATGRSRRPRLAESCTQTHHDCHVIPAGTPLLWKEGVGVVLDHI